MKAENLGTFISIYLNGHRFNNKDYEVMIDRLIVLSRSKYGREVYAKINSYIEAMTNKMFEDEDAFEQPKEIKKHIESKVLDLKNDARKSEFKKKTHKPLLINDETDETRAVIDIDHVKSKDDIKVSLGKYNSIKDIMTDKSLGFQEKMELTKKYVDRMNGVIQVEQESEKEIEQEAEVLLPKRRKTVHVSTELSPIEAKDFEKMDTKEAFAYLCENFPKKFAKERTQHDGKVGWSTTVRGSNMIPDLITFDFQRQVEHSKSIAGQNFKNYKYYVKPLEKHIYFTRIESN